MFFLDHLAARWLDRRDPLNLERERIARRVRWIVWVRDRGVCQYGIHLNCPGYVEPYEFELDHIWPVSKGGDNSLANLAVACRECNRKKSNKIIFPRDNGFRPAPRWWVWVLRLLFRSCD